MCTTVSPTHILLMQWDLARENAQKALELLPSDTSDSEDRRNGIKASAEQKLKQLGEAL